MNSKTFKPIFFSAAGLRWGWMVIFYFLIVIAAIAVIVGPPLLVNPSGGGAGLFELIGVGLVALILWRLSARLDSKGCE